MAEMTEEQWQAFLAATRTEMVAGRIIGIIDEGNKRAYLTEPGGAKTPEGEKLYQAWVDAGSPPLPEPGTPPGGASGAPTVTSLTPTSGPDGTGIVIVGTGFQAQGENSQVLIGVDPALVVAWSPESIMANAVLATSALDTPTTVYLQTADEQQVTAGTFTFTTGAGTLSADSSRRGKHA